MHTNPSRGGPYLLPHSTRNVRRDVIEYMGDAWKFKGETSREGCAAHIVTARGSSVYAFRRRSWEATDGRL
jgi:hypothetical protein